MKKLFLFLSLIGVISLFFLSFYYMVSVKKQLSSADIVVSIKPIHSMVTALTKGITKPELLLDGAVSPHHLQVTPSMVLTLKKAKLVVWIGSAYELSLSPYFKEIQAHVLTLQSDPHLALKSVRDGALWQQDDNHHHDHDEPSTHHALDGHIWLDPQMMITATLYTLAMLEKIYPQHQALLEKNAQKYCNRLYQLQRSLEKQLKKYQGAQYIIQHDGTQYFDNAFGVKTVATLIIEPGMPANAAHIFNIRQAIGTHKIQPTCIFAEAQFNTDVLKGYAANINLPIKTLDYLGTNIVPGEHAYENIMLAFVRDFIQGIQKYRKN